MYLLCTIIYGVYSVPTPPPQHPHCVLRKWYSKFDDGVGTGLTGLSIVQSN